MKVEERHGWALSESHDEILDLKSTLEDERYEHLLAKEALALRVKKQKAKDKESLTQAEEKQHKLQALVVAADRSGKELERRLRLETMEAHNAVNTCEILEATVQSMNMALEAMRGELELTKAKNREAEKELRRLQTVVKDMDKELRRRADDITAWTTKATQVEKTLTKKLANAEGRVNLYKCEVQEVELRVQALQQVSNDNTHVVFFKAYS
jgi:chromosome segregation ATPase